MEQQRFLSFSLEAGLLYADGVLCTSLKVNHEVLKAVLVEIKALMEDYEENYGKYVSSAPADQVNWDDHGEPQTDLMHLLCLNHEDKAGVGLPKKAQEARSSSRVSSLALIREQAASKARKLRMIITDRKRLSWVATDREGLETLVSKLSKLNSFLISLLDSSQIASLRRSMETGYMEMLQLRNDIRTLKVLMQALSVEGRLEGQTTVLSNDVGIPAAESLLPESTASEKEKRAEFQQLTQVKMLRLEIDGICENEVTTIMRSTSLLNGSSVFENFITVDQFPGTLPGERNIFVWDSQSVWVEWFRSPGKQWIAPSESKSAERRISLLANLLRQNLPLQFRIPPCLGYVKNHMREFKLAMGLLFKMPVEVQETSLVTLRQLLGTHPKPSLSARISLSNSVVECIYSFHSVDWLHKGIRSDNVIFFGQDIAQLNLGQPYITGFGLSRPRNEIDMTIKPETNLILDMYRHPNAQSEAEDNHYRKCYDLYSMGIVLLEIIHWQRIEEILQLCPSTLRRSAVQKIRGLLLGEESDEFRQSIKNISSNEVERVASPHLVKVAEKGGDVYKDIVGICLVADEIEKPIYNGESPKSIAKRLHLVFSEQILNRLRMMKESLTNND